jgi:hypothetical protein
VVEKLPDDVAALIRDDWRDLGFFYRRDDATRSWRLLGSRTGLMRFIHLLTDYAVKASHSRIGEHDHFGPHMYLTVQTAEEADITERAIYGRLEDISRLARLVRTRLQAASPGERIVIRDEYASCAEYSVLLEVQDESFDPSSLDPQL